MALLKDEQRMHWYVMRDLKRPNAKLPAYKQLSDEHLEVFTPMQWRLKLKNGKRIREEVRLCRTCFLSTIQEKF
jgi:hypothetical protein